MYEYCVVVCIYGQYTYHGQLHTYYNTLQCKSALSIHKMDLKFEKYTCMSKNLTCQKTAGSILI